MQSVGWYQVDSAKVSKTSQEYASGRIVSSGSAVMSIRKVAVGIGSVVLSGLASLIAPITGYSQSKSKSRMKAGKIANCAGSIQMSGVATSRTAIRFSFCRDPLETR